MGLYSKVATELWSRQLRGKRNKRTVSLDKTHTQLDFEASQYAKQCGQQGCGHFICEYARFLRRVHRIESKRQHE